MRRWLLASLFTFSIYASANACRFTVREIGFSTLSRDVYALVIIDKDANAADQSWQSVRNKLDDSNIQLTVLHPERNAEHPYVKQVRSNNLSLPSYVLIAPDGRMLELQSNGISELVDLVLDSPIRSRLRNDFTEVFSVILWVDGKDEMLNSEIETIIQGDCDRIKNIMPHMPKEVKNGPMSIRISAEDLNKEKILLWSLGMEQQPDEPVAFVLYGRGRIMGEAVDAQEVIENRLYKLMSMIGADCECGLDRRWMLGNQIPLLWPSESRQLLANDVGFDVDNPMILAEMSRILAKETNPDVAGDVGYGIEVIDLNTAFNEIPEIDYDETDSDQKTNPVLLIFLSFTVAIIAIGVFFFYRNKNR